ncbi:MAG: ribosomal RNA small subunit methyltransferase A [Labilithrix sp.]|nr:ribosomal RNA small subunit methyltransferase A [Labilithrix sp.]MCW5815873.1 ribosomal RNA small subunit methyltransferase A [Labilithrix sp.]
MLRRVGLAPKRSFGQNFLVSAHVVESIARACVPDAERGAARVVELGAGTGALTAALAARAAHVVAVERDRDLVPVLRDELAAHGNVTVVEGDAQSVVPRELLGAEPGPRVLAGNLPYQITGRLLELATTHADDLDRVVFMVQLEVAERLAARPGTKAYGALTVFVGAAFEVTKLFDVSPGSFHPPPEVTSAVVALTPRRPRAAAETETFRALVKGAFGARRKTLRNAWSKVAAPDRIAAAAASAGISLDARGETLSVDAFARMASRLDESEDATARRM